ncbi:glycoside hydrolase family 127 protein [Actinoalloteichus hymeniacidonis]|uniref:Glycoside hydrolase family 127 protein n=1 Tax=Actinoalloteichus hymeniacidonis TaxID=340345 RepID=A0AAC9HQL3_9PSEU|nr:beta-L-arabinofuranosidase domain-containing protein [Actinoalloteichus hymeniacidonis]AOS63772.1 hypothetical protein TL08_14815 [Actinoalloteichus hymeniacidonis]MBB5908174.1 hypothetical protein [Actinoalloteichus hymeniacidonis]
MDRKTSSEREVNSAASPAQPGRTAAVAPTPERVSAMPADRVVLRGGLLADWQRRNRAATIPHTIERLRAEGSLGNIRAVAETTGAEYVGRYPFLDTDVYKTLEGLAYEIGRGEADEETTAFWEEAVGLIERAQRSDGYLNSFVQNQHTAREPWSDLAWGHELYNLGHLLQAALAASRQAGDDRLLHVARRFADLAVTRFATTDDACGHPEVEMALVELTRHTGDQRYLDLAASFVDRRGHGAIPKSFFAPDYFQDDAPFRELTGLRGHAVRMVYLAAGATDVAIERGDAELLAASRRLWDDMVATRLYLTGGLGARHSDEAVGDRYELPAERSYSETCAAIGTMQWAWRLLLATGDARYGDVFERILYNAYAVALSQQGTAFSYDNPLQRRPEHRQGGGAPAGSPPRREWFVCACCPPNVIRWMAELQDHLAITTPAGVGVVVYADAEIETPQLAIDIRTAYPDDGRITVTVRRGRAGAELALRMPDWATEATVRIDGAAVPAEVGEGWLRLRRDWTPDTVVELDLPMPVRLHGAHPAVDALRGSIAVARGPVVYCAEQQDQDVPLDEIVLRTADLATARLRREPLGSQPDTEVVRITLDARAHPPVSAELYPVLGSANASGPEDTQTAEDTPTSVDLLPYRLWANREPGAMRVWLRTE